MSSRGVLDAHVGRAGHHRRGGVVAGAVVAGAPVRHHAHRQVAVGDEADRAAVVDQDHRADVALAHELGDLADGRARTGGDHGLGHHLPDQHAASLPRAYTSRPMAPLTPQQLAWRGRVETLIRLMEPGLDLMLAVGERIARVAEPEDLDVLATPRRLGDHRRAPRCRAASD